MTSVRMTIVPLILLLPLCALAADLETLVKECNECHGPDGVSGHSDVPTIAGQSFLVLEDALLNYADEARKCVASEYYYGDTSRPAVTMCEVAAKLSEDDMADLAELYEALPFVAAKQEFDAALADQGAIIHERHCDRCHSENGSYAGDDAGLLAGQWTPYLRQTTMEFINGERPMPEKMSERMARLDEDDVESLLNFYAREGN